MSTAAAPSGLRQRAVTALILAPLGIAAVIYLPSAGFALLLGLVCALGLREWSRLSGLASPLIGVIYLALNALLMLWLWRQGFALLRDVSTVGAVFWCLAPLWLMYYGFAARPALATSIFKHLIGVLVIVPAWCAGALLHADPDRGALWVLFVVVLIWCADVFAYFSGRRFGGRKLAPRISPGKTWAGVYGGLLGAALYASICGWLFGIRGQLLLAFVALSMVTVAISIAGDLFESLMKRHSGMKDSGQLFPGHGGALDRFDSLFAALPVFVFGKLVLGV